MAQTTPIMARMAGRVAVRRLRSAAGRDIIEPALCGGLRGEDHDRGRNSHEVRRNHATESDRRATGNPGARPGVDSSLARRPEARPTRLRRGTKPPRTRPSRVVGESGNPYGPRSRAART